MKNLDLHLFYTYELLMFNNLGNGECSDLANINVAANGCTGTVGYFQNKDTSSTHTVGASGEWKVSEKLKLKADYTVSYGSVMFTEFNGVFVAKPTLSYQNVTNYPDIDALMNSLSLMASYQLTPSIELILQGVYSSYHNTDWRDDPSAIQGAGTTAISTLSTGTAQPNWSIGTVMAGMRIKFGEGPPLLPPVTMVTPAAAVQPARSYLVFFDWDKATLTDRARQIIKDAATNSTHVQHTPDRGERLHRHLRHAAVQHGPVDPPRRCRQGRADEGRRARERDRHKRFRRDASAGAHRRRRARAAESPGGDRHPLTPSCLVGWKDGVPSGAPSFGF